MFIFYFFSITILGATLEMLKDYTHHLLSGIIPGMLESYVKPGIKPRLAMCKV